MNKYVIGVILSLVLVIGVVIAINLSKTTVVEIASDTEMEFSISEYDFGIIKQSGGLVSYEFPFVYSGDIERTVLGVVGSCGCTTGSIDKEVLKQGDSGVITVTFDPNLHEEPEGRFYKTVSLVTDPPFETEPEVKIWTEIDLDLGPEFFTLTANKSDKHEDEHSSQEYGEIHADELAVLLEDKDFFLVDVHIPEQEHIDGTDAFVPFNEIENKLGLLPQDKDSEIVLYCRSGSMSQVAAKTLIENGYTNVSYLEGGIKEYNKLNK